MHKSKLGTPVAVYGYEQIHWILQTFCKLIIQSKELVGVARESLVLTGRNQKVIDILNNHIIIDIINSNKNTSLNICDV